MMKFKIALQDGTVIYANDICIYGPPARYVAIWSHGEEIDSIETDKVHNIWLLDPVMDILIYV